MQSDTTAHAYLLGYRKDRWPARIDWVPHKPTITAWMLAHVAKTHVVRCPARSAEELCNDLGWNTDGYQGSGLCFAPMFLRKLRSQMRALWPECLDSSGRPVQTHRQHPGRQTVDSLADRLPSQSSEEAADTGSKLALHSSLISLGACEFATSFEEAKAEGIQGIDRTVKAVRAIEAVLTGARSKTVALKRAYRNHTDESCSEIFHARVRARSQRERFPTPTSTSTSRSAHGSVEGGSTESLGADYTSKSREGSATENASPIKASPRPSFQASRHAHDRLMKTMLPRDRVETEPDRSASLGLPWSQPTPSWPGKERAARSRSVSSGSRASHESGEETTAPESRSLQCSAPVHDRSSGLLRRCKKTVVATHEPVWCDKHAAIGEVFVEGEGNM